MSRLLFVSAMCYFITIGVAEGRAAALGQHLSGPFGVVPVSNESILKRLPPGFLAFGLGGMCHCHLYARARAEPPDAEKLRDKYRRRGWSEGKISRAISGKLSARRGSFKGLRPDLRESLRGLTAEVGRLAIVVHFYSGGAESEPVPIAGKRVVSCDGLIEDEESVPEDMLVEVVA